MGVALNATTGNITFAENFTNFSTMGPVLSERERIRIEFYQTYDIMTGIRIAATLGGFFTMMVLLVLYKSKCKSRADESLEAAITAAVAEEEELEAVLNHSKYDFTGHEPRQSLGNMSAPAYTRFSSIGGYSSFINPPMRRFDRLAKGRISLPASDLSFRYFPSAPTSSISSQEQKSSNFWKSYNEEDENDLVEVEENEDINDRKFLQIPNHHHKFHPDSNTNSFCIERREPYSPVKYLSKTNKENFKSPIYNQPNIQVIQATPQISPCESSSGLLDDQCMVSNQPLTLPERKLAPLASIGSCSAISSIDSENRSMGSDSVFMNNENVEDDDDTDKDQNDEELLSSKSDQDCTNKKYRIIPTTELSNCFVMPKNKIPNRRFSDSGMQLCRNVDKANVSLFPIVTNLASHASSQITTSLYNKSRMPDECSSSNTSLSSSFSYSNSLSSDKRKRGAYSRIAVIDMTTTSLPIKTDRINTKTKLSLSKSEPKTINTFCDNSIKNLRTLSLKNLMKSKIWSKETLF
ncbi:hypothetical protein PGB90_010254 [Kerria lacca]